MAHKVVFAPEARDDLRNLYVFIAEQSGDATAVGHLARIECYCRGFADFPERGLRRDDLAPGLRIIGFERRISIAFHVDEDVVTFDRFFYGGRDIDRSFAPEGEADPFAARR